MAIDEYITTILAGAMPIRAGAFADGKLVETVGVLDPADLDAVTAEAYNQDVFGADVTWDDARGQIEAALASTAKSRRPTVRVVVQK